MARTRNRLNPLAVKSATKQGMYADGGGLYLQVSRFKTKSWVFRFARNGKTRDMGLGSVEDISLKDARQKAETARRQLSEGIDPIEARRDGHQKAWLDAARAQTFKQCAEAYIKAHGATWKNAKHASQWGNTLRDYVYPCFGNLPVAAVDVGLVLKALEPIWTEKAETASRVRQRIEAILDYAAARKYRQGENPARWKGHLDKLLPAHTKVRKVKHHAAMPYDQIGAFMTHLRQRTAIAALGLEFLILTAARTGEVIGAQWNEIDLTENVWTIPAERMKADREHRVPLSPAAVAVLKTMHEVATSDYVFPGSGKDRPLSNMAFLQLLKRMEYRDLTAHGFRSTFRDWAAERTGFPSEVAELALAHTVGNKVEAAYRRGDMFEKRRKLMEAWADYCAKPEDKSGTVVPLKQGA